MVEKYKYFILVACRKVFVIFVLEEMEISKEQIKVHFCTASTECERSQPLKSWKFGFTLKIV